MKIDVNKFATCDHTTLKLAIQALRSYLKLTCEYEFHIQPNTEGGSLVEVSHLCSFYQECWHTLIKINVNKFAVWDHTTLILDIEGLRSYLKLTCQYEFHI